MRDAAEQVLGFMPTCRIEVPADMLTAVATNLRADPRLKAELHYQHSQVFTAHANIRGDVVFLERALATLKDVPSVTEVLP